MRLKLQATSAQWKIIREQAPEQILVAGRRWGKTVTIRNKMICIAAEKGRGAEIWYVAPTYSLCRAQYDAILLNRSARKLITRQRQQPYPRITLKWGASLSFRSADRPNNLRGDGLDAVFCDEAAYLDKSFIDQIIRPTLADKRGLLFLAGTFRGENWYFDLHKLGRKSNADGIVSWTYPTPTGIRFQGKIGQRHLEREKRRVPLSVWEQEYLCIPNANLNAALKFVEQAIGGEPRTTPGKGPYVLGWDTGKAADPSALVVLDCQDGTVAWAETLKIGLSYDAQLARVRKLADTYHALVVVDSTGAGTKDAILDFARRRIRNARGLQFKGRNQEEFIKQLDLAMQGSKIKIPRQFGSLVQQLKLYEYRYSGARLTYGAPPGEHDDLVAALAMAWWAYIQHWTPKSRTTASLEAALY